MIRWEATRECALENSFRDLFFRLSDPTIYIAFRVVFVSSLATLSFNSAVPTRAVQHTASFILKAFNRVYVFSSDFRVDRIRPIIRLGTDKNPDKFIADLQRAEILQWEYFSIVVDCHKHQLPEFLQKQLYMNNGSMLILDDFAHFSTIFP